MKLKNRVVLRWAALPALALGLALGGAPQANASTIIFQDDFSGSGNALNGTTPDTTTGGEQWVAGATYLDDGSAGPFANDGSKAGSTATLAFTPSAGTIYNLDARIDNTGGGDWLGLGFADGQSTGTGSNNRFVGGSTPEGRVWMLMSSTGVGNTFQNGTSAAYGVDTAVNSTGFIDLRIVLDTTAATWTATWYAKDAASATYTVVHSTEDVLSQGTINAVGIVGNEDAAGIIESFSLTEVPEPSTLALLGLGGLMMARRRH